MLSHTDVRNRTENCGVYRGNSATIVAKIPAKNPRKFCIGI